MDRTSFAFGRDCKCPLAAINQRKKEKKKKKKKKENHHKYATESRGLAPAGAAYDGKAVVPKCVAESTRSRVTQLYLVKASLEISYDVRPLLSIMLKSEAAPTFNSCTEFYVSETGSRPSTRTSSPATEFHGESYQHNDDVYLEVKSPVVVLETIPGVLPDEVYDSALTWWRACIRRLLVRNLKIESRWLAVMQVWVPFVHRISLNS